MKPCFACNKLFHPNDESLEIHIVPDEGLESARLPVCSGECFLKACDKLKGTAKEVIDEIAADSKVLSKPLS